MKHLLLLFMSAAILSCTDDMNEVTIDAQHPGPGLYFVYGADNYNLGGNPQGLIDVTISSLFRAEEDPIGVYAELEGGLSVSSYSWTINGDTAIGNGQYINLVQNALLIEEGENLVQATLSTDDGEQTYSGNFAFSVPESIN